MFLLSELRHCVTIQNSLYVTVVLIFCLCHHHFTWWRSKRNGSKVSSKKLPGPGHHFLGTLFNIMALRNEEKCLDVIQNWGEQYGPVYKVSFGPFTATVLNSPDYVQKLLGSRDMNYYPKGFIYQPFKPFWNDGIGISKGEKWKLRRRVLTKHMFSFKTLLGYMTIFNEEADKVVYQLGEMFPEGGEEYKKIVDVLMSSVLNVITETTFGKSIADFESTDKESSEPTFTECVDGVKEIVATRVIQPYLLSDLLWRLHPLSKVADLLSRTIWKMANRVIADTSTVTNLGIKQDLVDEGIPLEGIAEEAVTLISTGYETTFTSLHFVLFLLACHPEHQERCREEVDLVFEDRELCSSSGYLEHAALSKLKYLEMCVNECLRLLHPVFLIMRKIEAPLQLEDDLVIPAGSQVAVFAPGIHKNPNHFPNPNKFDPERFAVEEVKKRHPCSFIPFAAGPRVCIGQKFAMMEILTFTAKILRNYVITTKDILDDIVFLPYITLTPKKPMEFRLKRRVLKK